MEKFLKKFLIVLLLAAASRNVYTPVLVRGRGDGVPFAAAWKQNGIIMGEGFTLPLHK